MPEETMLAPHHLQGIPNEAQSTVDLPANTISTTTHPIKETTVNNQEKADDAKPPQQLYFAFGSNLSHTQMRQRCISAPEISAKPLAVARLDGWRWIITERGYANVIPVQGFDDYFLAQNIETSDRRAVLNAQDETTSHEEHVYGIIYAMTPSDEGLLDGYEGVDYSSDRTSSTCSIGKQKSVTRPREQGNGAYNKWYLTVRVVRWLDDGFRDNFASRAVGEDGDGDRDRDRDRDGDGDLKALVYVDEYRVTEGEPNREYIGRMNRGIREAAELGLPLEWVNKVVRKFIIPAE